MDKRSVIPVEKLNTDEEESRCESDKKMCCWSFFRMFTNDKDMSFTPAEINFFDRSANSYNLANFLERKMNTAGASGKCLTLYFLANFAIVQGKRKEGEQHVREGLQIAKTLPRKQDLYFLLLASPYARLYYMNENIDGLRRLLDNCFQKIDALGRGVPGSVLGWLHYMRARAHKNDKSAAIADFELAIDAFNLSETIDKDFGVAHTLCRLIICRLGCGERADTIDDVETPFPEEMRRVKSHFKQLENMEIVNQNLVIRIIYLMAETDYFFRTRNVRLALDRSKEAHQLAVSSKCDEFLEVTMQRIKIYASKFNEMPTVHQTNKSTNVASC